MTKTSRLGPSICAAHLTRCGFLDRKSTRLNLQSPCNLVCRLLLEKKNNPVWSEVPGQTLDEADKGRIRYRVKSHALRGNEIGQRATYLDYSSVIVTVTTDIYTLYLYDALPI